MTSTNEVNVRACVGDKHANVADVYIDGKPYEFRPHRETADNYAVKINAIACHSHGKALAWAKENGDYLGKAVCP